MQSCGETKSFILKTLPRPSSAHEISLRHKRLGRLDLSWNILWVLFNLKLLVPWSWPSSEPWIPYSSGHCLLSDVTGKHCLTSVHLSPSALPYAGLHLWLWEVLEGQGVGFCCVDDGLQPWPVGAQVREACSSLCPLTPGLLTGVPSSVSDTSSRPWGHLCALAPVPLQQQLSGRGGSARADLCPSRAADLRGERCKVPLPIPSKPWQLNCSGAHSCSVGTWVLGLSCFWEMLGKDAMLYHPLWHCYLTVLWFTVRLEGWISLHRLLPSNLQQLLIATFVFVNKKSDNSSFK